MPIQGERTHVILGGAGVTGPVAAGDKIEKDISQIAHGFDVGSAIYNTGSAFAKARSDSGITLGVWVVSAVADVDNFTAVQAGFVDTLSGLTTGEYYYVSGAASGVLTSTAPTTGYSNPMLFSTSTTTGWVLPFRANAVAASGSTSAATAGDKIQKDISQTAHGFSIGSAIYNTGSAFAKARADSDVTLGLWIVSAVADVDNFTIVQAGFVDTLSGLTAGEYYYVSTAASGVLTSTAPTTGYNNPMLFSTSTTAGWVLPFIASAVTGSGSGGGGTVDFTAEDNILANQIFGG